MNAYHIKVNKICASCKHKECTSDGTRVCQDGLKNAGLQNGGVFRLKGTQEIIIK